jgi:hypothetical protein
VIEICCGHGSHAGVYRLATCDGRILLCSACLARWGAFRSNLAGNLSKFA